MNQREKEEEEGRPPTPLYCLLFFQGKGGGEGGGAADPLLGGVLVEGLEHAVDLIDDQHLSGERVSISGGAHALARPQTLAPSLAHSLPPRQIPSGRVFVMNTRAQ